MGCSESKFQNEESLIECKDRKHTVSFKNSGSDFGSTNLGFLIPDMPPPPLPFRHQPLSPVASNSSTSWDYFFHTEISSNSENLEDVHVEEIEQKVFDEMSKRPAPAAIASATAVQVVVQDKVAMQKPISEMPLKEGKHIAGPAAGVGDKKVKKMANLDHSLLRAPEIAHENFDDNRGTIMSWSKFSRILEITTSSMVSTLDKLNETVEMLKKKEDVLLNEIFSEIERAKEFKRAKDKHAAIQCLKRKRLLEQQVELLENFQLRIHQKSLYVILSGLRGMPQCLTTVVALRCRFEDGSNSKIALEHDNNS